MEYIYSMRVYNLSGSDIPSVIIKMMKGLGFAPVEDQDKRNFLHVWETGSTPPVMYTTGGLDPTLIYSYFAIFPPQNHWCLIQTNGGYSDEQLYSQLLSTYIDDLVMLLLLDDLAGWGYEFYQNGRLLDRYHTYPAYSEMLVDDRDYPVDYSIDYDAELAKMDFQGNPSVLASILNISEDQARSYLELDTMYPEDAHENMWAFLNEFKIPEPYRIETSNNPELVFTRKMNSIELAWCDWWRWEGGQAFGPPLSVSGKNAPK